MLNLTRRNRDEDPAGNPMRTLHHEMDRLVRSFFDEEGGLMGGGGSWPSVDLTESADAYALSAELPGMDAGAVDIQVTGDVLTVSGTKEERRRGGDSTTHFTERRYGAWRRSFRLPALADTAGIEARMNDGVLEITIPKRAEARPQTIRVRAESSKPGSEPGRAGEGGARTSRPGATPGRASNAGESTS